MNLLTIDIDWAPDWMITEVAEFLLNAKVKATWFATHMSRAVEELVKEQSFEVGIHPNCLPGSSQGKNEDEVMSYLKRLFPEAKAMRAHCLYSNTGFLHKAARVYGLDIDVSIFLDGIVIERPYKRFFSDGSFIWQVPFGWEDDIWLCSSPDWGAQLITKDQRGIKIYNFHCVHIYLNSETIRRYEKMKEYNPNVNTWTRTFVDRYKNRSEIGIAHVYLELIDCLRGTGMTISELIECAKESKRYVL